MSDQGVYQHIGSMLLGVCPAEAARIVLRAEMSASGDYLGPTVYYTLADGSEAQARVRPIIGDLHHAFLDLRRLTVGEGKEPWSTCVFTLDAASGKFEVSFGYEDLGF